MPAAWSLHPQLERDTASFGDLPLARVLVINDANFPWLLLVPRRPDIVELIDLDEVEQAQLMTEIARVVGPNTAHKYHPDSKIEISRMIDAIAARGRDPYPRKVRFTTWTLAYNRMMLEAMERFLESQAATGSS